MSADRTVSVREIVRGDALYSGEAIAGLSEGLRRLVDPGGVPGRLVVDFRGVRAMSSDVLGVLASLHRRLGPGRVRLAVTGLDPSLREMLRICRLDGLIEILADDPDAVGLGLPPTGAGRVQ